MSEFISGSPEHGKITAQPLTPDGLKWAQGLVISGHYLHSPVDPRGCPLGYKIHFNEIEFGCLIFGRPEATRCKDWYGSVEDVQSGKCEVTRWQVLNLARVFILPDFQLGGRYWGMLWLPHFTDRSGLFRSKLVSTVIGLALDRVVHEYLIARPPCFLDEPYQLEWCMSYCDTRLHKGAIYRAAGFELFPTDNRHIHTWRKRLRPLTPQEDAAVQQASAGSPRSRQYRAARNAIQLGLWEAADAA